MRSRSPAPHVVVVGAGFGGLEAARALGRADVATTLIDRNNYHLFQPLLYQVATAALSPADVADPIRHILSRYASVEVVLGEVTGVDHARRVVRTRGGRSIAFDHLILATGATYSYFGHDEWAANAPGLKTIEDARLIRSNILLAFERAEIEADAEEQQRLMTVVIVGGGPTGVEMAGSIAELSRYALARDFRRIRPQSATIHLVEAGPRLLPTFPDSLSDYARRELTRLGVTVTLGQPVRAIEPNAVRIGDTRIAAGTIIWAAGVHAAPPDGSVDAPGDRVGRVRVNPDLSLPGKEGVYVIGDLALLPDESGRPLPGLAQVAKQQGAHLGRALAENIRTGKPLPPFRFHDRGNVAIIGRRAALFDFGRFQLTGTLAWMLWALVHVYLLVGFQHRLSVCLQWFWRYLTYQRGARLIIERMFK